MGLGASCPACGTVLRADARFCDQCGSSISLLSRVAEYKQVTVLFTDVVHSMGIAAAVGPERLREIMSALVQRCAEVVRRYGGTPDKFTGDGIMAVFGAPVALEDHAVRAALAALAIQGLDGLDVQLRIGLNSGEVIAGELSSGPWGYTAIGEAVGMAQRMEAAAPAGGIMLSESTARLLGHAGSLSEPELVRIKGSEQPVTAYRLLGMAAGRTVAPSTGLVGRQWEVSTVAAIVDRALSGRGSVIGLVGPPGIGKSRLIHEASAIASLHGVDVFGVYCESHTADIPFHVVAGLLHQVGIAAQTRTLLPDADADDLMLLDDLLGYRDAGSPRVKINPDARRRRLTALISAATLARTTPALYILEDVHWVDEVSESMIADFLAVIPQTRSAVLITYRPEYRGGLSRIPGSQTIALAPLSDSETTTLVGQLLGSDHSLAAVATLIAGRAAGNPFFAAEMVRDLAERNVLTGHRGHHACNSDIGDLTVPPTLQATIAARIDRLSGAAKRTLNAASVIGSRFDISLFDQLGVVPSLDELVASEMIDQVGFGENPEFAFRHPLIRAVAYESQLKTDRADLHRRLAAALQQQKHDSLDEHAALIAEHLEAAGDATVAFGWHMRAGAWSTSRDITAARRSWERARRLADELPADEPNQLPMRIAARTFLCATAFRRNVLSENDGFEELSELCGIAGDKASLAIATTGLVGNAMGLGDVRKAARLLAVQLELIESLSDPALTVGLFAGPTTVLIQLGEWSEVLRWSQKVIDLADGDPTMGNYIVGSPLAIAYSTRGSARCALGHPGWRDDFDRATTMAGQTDALSLAMVVAYKTALATANGALLPDDDALRDAEDAVRIVEAWGDSLGLGITRYSLGITLAQRDAADRARGLEVLSEVRRMCVEGLYYRSELPPVDAWIAWIAARDGDLDGAIPDLREAISACFAKGQLGYCTSGTRTLVDVLLTRGTADDVAEAEAAVERLKRALPGDGPAIRDITVLYARASLARAHGRPAEVRLLARECQKMAAEHGYTGYLAMAEQMLDS